MSLPPPVKLSGYTLAVVAKEAGVHHRTLRRAIFKGRVKAIPIPHRKLIPPEEAERLIAEGLRQRAPGAGGGPRR